MAREDFTIRTALRRARHLARQSSLPPVPEREAHRWTLRASVAMRAVRRLGRRVRSDRIVQRAAALAFYTLLSFVPTFAVAFAVLGRVVGLHGSAHIVQGLTARYFPSATEGALDFVSPLVTGVDLGAVGIVGLVALLPVTTSLVRQVDAVLGDIFRSPVHPPWSPRFLLYAALVLGVPFVAIFGVRMAPHQVAYSILDRHVGTLAVTTLILFVAFHFLPTRRVGWRHSLPGAFVAALGLEVAKALFSLYATYLGRGIHLVWGAVAFVPFLLLWMLTAWVIVLFGAEISATTQELALQLRRNELARAPVVQGWRRRLRRKVARRQRDLGARDRS